MEKNRIYNAVIGLIFFIVLPVLQPAAQEEAPDGSDIVDKTAEDSLKSDHEKPIDKGRLLPGDKIEPFAVDTAYSDTFAVVSAEFPASDSIVPETIDPTLYQMRKFLSRGAGDELKNEPSLFLQTPGPVGSPLIAARYINVTGVDIDINDHPFLYNNIYRPYRTGTDLNAVPWEILNSAGYSYRGNLNGRINFRTGRPGDNINRSDVEIARGPYSHSSSRWRFFRPFDDKTYGYFTVGFNKSGGYIINNDYDAFHVCGGLRRRLFNGLFDIDLWKYRAKGGVSSFELLVPQLSRLSRTARRIEASYTANVADLFGYRISGVYQRNDQTINDITASKSVDNDIGGWAISVNDSLSGAVVDLGMRYYRLRTYSLPGVRPAFNIFEYSGRSNWEFRGLKFKAELTYSWNGVDHGEMLPSGLLRYNVYSGYFIYASAVKSRIRPDLSLLYLNDDVENLGLTGFLESYSFVPEADLSFPVTSEYSAGFDLTIKKIIFNAEASFIEIKDQVYLSYLQDVEGTRMVTPINFDDRFMEFTLKGNSSYGPFDGEFGVAYRKWDERYFADGLEKGPALMGFGRISALRSFFFDDLFLGGSLEFRGSSRQDYRSIRVGLADGFGVFNGRLEFRYKDFIFWWNEDNILNGQYTTWWPYPQAPRTLWWGFRWRFFD